MDAVGELRVYEAVGHLALGALNVGPGCGADFEHKVVAPKTRGGGDLAGGRK